VKRVIIEALLPEGYAVLNAADPLVAEMAPYSKGGVIFFAIDGNHPVIVAHRAAGKRAVFVREDYIVLAEGQQETILTPLAHVPLTHDGRIGFQVENALATAAAAWGFGMSHEAIVAGLESFAPDMETVPGRFNLLEIDGATVILDYGHNVSSLAAMIEVVKRFPHEYRAVVYSAAGDRRDEDMVRQGQMLGENFDRVILYEDHYLRGRAEGEIMSLFRQGCSQPGQRVRETMEVRGALKAVETALAMLRPGDLVLIQADKIGESVDFVRQHLATRPCSQEIDLNEALDVPVKPAAAAAKKPAAFISP
jgi:cyanophycin synthetase